VIDEQREHFEREYGCTEREWRGWMPTATGGHECTDEAPQAMNVRVGAGHLRLRWQVLPPRTIALLRLPRLAVSFAFDGVSLEDRLAFLRRFDLHLQRGGG